VHVALRALDAPDLQTLLAQLAQTESTETVWFLPGDRPPDPPEPRAQTARILRDWNGTSAVVEHDGTCDLVIRRTYAPGWTARINDGPEIPVARGDGGLQVVRLPGMERDRVTLQYSPDRLGPTAVLSLTTLGAALVVLILGTIRRAKTRTLAASTSAPATPQSPPAPA
jgi:hypothetical protein